MHKKILTVLIGFCFVAIFSSVDEALYHLEAAQQAIRTASHEPTAKQSVDYAKLQAELEKIKITMQKSRD